MAKSDMPIYQQLAENIRRKIADGTFKVGDKLPSERIMAKTYGLNRLTVRKALQELIQENTLYAARGSGNFVKAIVPNGKKVHFGTDEDISLSAVLRQSGFDSSRRIISFKKIKTVGEYKDYFKYSEFVYELVRLSYIDGQPYALQISYFPSRYFLQPERFDFETGSLYTYMEIQGHRPTTIISDMWLAPVLPEYEKIMNVKKNKHVFYYEYFGFDAAHTMVEFTRSYYAPEYTSFHYRVKKANKKEHRNESSRKLRL